METSATGGRNILLLEDDPDLSDIITAILDSEGYQVTAMLTEEQALAALAATRYDLVITDSLADPAQGEERWAVMARIRDAAGATPIVICTAHHPGYFAEFAEHGFSALVAKPFDLDELLGPVRRLLAAAPCAAGDRRGT